MDDLLVKLLVGLFFWFDKTSISYNVLLIEDCLRTLEIISDDKNSELVLDANYLRLLLLFISCVNNISAQILDNTLKTNSS